MITEQDRINNFKKDFLEVIKRNASETITSDPEYMERCAEEAANLKFNLHSVVLHLLVYGEQHEDKWK